MDDLKAHHTAETAVFYRSLNCRAQVVGLVLLDLYVGVTGDAKGVVPMTS